MSDDPHNGKAAADSEPLDFNRYDEPAPMRAQPSALAIVATAFISSVAGLGVGYFASVYLGLWLWPNSNLAPLPFLFTLCPIVSVATPLFSLWILWLAQARDQRVAKGQCPGCGYDLRASCERCPECGRWID